MSSLPLEMPHEHTAHIRSATRAQSVEASSVPRHVDGKCGHDRTTHVEDAYAPQCVAAGRRRADARRRRRRDGGAHGVDRGAPAGCG
jgi:hypothetical protein